ncbi:dsDNA nuclease domain-containing protein [Paenibacillus sp. sgz302251]|uniref:dsDNA nuclease domain-containing protein n=1 Tax=Paenibacillus sp. sgz302251 TaxID=3414493 RepID=UPI003C7DF633
MQNILNLNLREKAGSDSYNRFEYQAHWILYHMLENIQNKKTFLVFCEFHDDMAESEYSPSSNSMNFYQVKTTSTKEEWKLSSLFQKSKRVDGSYKNSFLGFIFYNFDKFSTDCSSCHFVSNADFDDDVLQWQSVVKDHKELKKENLALYTKIKNYLLVEYPTMPKQQLDIVFDRFIQNTFFTKSPLSLEGHVEQVKGVFFEVASRFNLDMKSGYLLLTNIIDSVRKKTRTIIRTPISYEELKMKKGISSDIFNELEETFSSIPKLDEMYELIGNYLKKNELSNIKINAILKAIKKHHKKALDINDALYQDIIRAFIQEIDEIVEDNFYLIDDFNIQNNLLENLIEGFLEKQIHQEVNSLVLRGVFYEAILSGQSSDV